MPNRVENPKTVTVELKLKVTYDSKFASHRNVVSLLSRWMKEDTAGLSDDLWRSLQEKCNRAQSEYYDNTLYDVTRVSDVTVKIT